MYILDTHILLWLTANPDKLSPRVTKIIVNKQNQLFLSKATLWEIATKTSLKKLELGMPLKEFVNDYVVGNNIQILDISTEHIIQLCGLPFIHRDPFDRMIIAQGIVEGHSIISSDKNFSKYKVKILA